MSLRDKAALTESFILENQKSFYRLAYSYVRDPDTAMDLVQDAVVRALQKQGSLRAPEHLKTWFYRILVNECLMYLRQQKAAPLPLEDAYAAPATGFEDAAALFDAVSHLAPELKTVVFLRFYTGMKLSQVAEATGENLSTVKTRLYKALRLLRMNLDPEGAEHNG